MRERRRTTLKEMCHHCEPRGTQRTGRMILFRIVENLAHSSIKNCSWGSEHFVLRNEIPRNLVTSFHSQLSNEFALRSSVSLAKRMQSIDLAKVVSGASANSLVSIPRKYCSPAS